MPPDSPVVPGEVIAGKYRVDSVIAVGGMGIVVAAEHRQLGQEVAIKVLLPEELTQEPHAATRFLREARAAAGIRSDHVVRIHDVDSLESGLPYMVMERLHGSDLRALLRARGPLPIADVVEYVTQACDALAQAHRMGIVHRDLKPSNLFLTTKNDGTPVVKVLDFGISKAVQQSQLEGTLTSSRTLIGSPLYMSPEQIRDPKAVDARSDIWSLGVILHQLLTDKPAFSADSLPAVCAAIAADPPASLRERRPDVPEELERVVQRCLEKRPERRFQSVEELCAALAPFGRRGAAATSPTLPAPAGDGAEESIADAPTVSYRQLLDDPSALRRSVPDHLVSEAPLAATRRSDGIPERRRPVLLIGVALLLALALGAALVLLLRPAPESAAPAADARRITATIVSTPSGAEVFDGEQRLGQTPLTLPVPTESAPRALTLRLPGYDPHPLEVKPADTDTSIQVTLTRASAAASATAPAAASETPAAAPPPAARAPRWKPKPPPESPKPSGGTDIRLER